MYLRQSATITAIHLDNNKKVHTRAGFAVCKLLFRMIPMIFHAVLCSIQWLKFLAWEEFDEEIWGEGLRPAYIENSIKFTPEFLVTLNSKLMIKTVSSSFRVCNLIMFINTCLIIFALLFPPMFVFVFPHSKMGRLGIEFLPLNWKSRHVSNLFPFSYCELMEISFHTLSPIYIWYRNI